MADTESYVSEASEFSNSEYSSFEGRKDDITFMAKELQDQIMAAFPEEGLLSSGDSFKAVAMDRKEVMERIGGPKIKSTETVTLLRPPQNQWIALDHYGLNVQEMEGISGGKKKTESEISQMEGEDLEKYFHQQRSAIYAKLWKSFNHSAIKMKALGGLVKKVNRRRLNGSAYDKKLKKMRIPPNPKSNKVEQNASKKKNKCYLCDNGAEKLKMRPMCDMCESYMGPDSLDVTLKSLNENAAEKLNEIVFKAAKSPPPCQYPPPSPHLEESAGGEETCRIDEL